MTSLVARLRAGVSAVRRPDLFDPPPPLPKRPEPVQLSDGSLVMDMTPLPVPPSGKRWTMVSSSATESHRDWFVRGVFVGATEWMLVPE